EYKFKDLPKGAKIGTSSTRRKAQLLRIRPDLQIEDIRGNVHTRIRKLKEYDAIVMAKAGLNRLDIDIEVEELDFTTSAGQGAIAVASKEGSGATEIINKLDHEATRIEVEIERSILGGLGGGCIVPMGTSAEIQGDRVTVKSDVLSLDGKRDIVVKREFPLNDYKKGSLEVVGELKKRGGSELIREAMDAS
ncbi:MAG: hydroxymethylbilane synthase, partial [Halobacteriota archaeon]|nr:hydroxymethylbilane synthase [Halobacteriota archaeon]